MKKKNNKKNLDQLIVSDALFKDVYSNVHLLISFLIAFFMYVGFDYHNVFEELEHYEEKYLKKAKRKQKDMRVDLLVYLKNYIIDIEPYTLLNESGLIKIRKYLSRIDGGQLRPKEDYESARKVIGIVIAYEVSESLKLDDHWFQRYNFKGEGPDYTELSKDIEIFILRLDKLPKVDYYNAINYDLLLRHLWLMQETSEKKRKQIAREDEDLMTIATSPTDLKQDKELRKIYNWEENLKNVFYGEGQMDRNIEIAKDLLEKKYDIQEIISITGLSIEEIEQLKEK